MLVLTREKGERIVLRFAPSKEQTEIVIEVLEFEKINDPEYREIRLGISAPNRVSINRGEIQDKIDAGVPR